MSALRLEPLTEGAVALRMLGRDDLATTLAWRNDPGSRTWFHSDDVIAWESHVAWFEGYLGRDGDHVFILEDEGRPAAQVSLYRVTDGSAEFGRLLVDPDARGKGYGNLASRLCLQVADERLGLDRVHLEVKRDNAAAIKIYEGLGFVVEESSSTPADSLFMQRSR